MTLRITYLCTSGLGMYSFMQILHDFINMTSLRISGWRWHYASCVGSVGTPVSHTTMCLPLVVILGTHINLTELHDLSTLGIQHVTTVFTQPAPSDFDHCGFFILLIPNVFGCTSVCINHILLQCISLFVKLDLIHHFLSTCMKRWFPGPYRKKQA